MNIGRKIFFYIGLIAVIPFLVSLYLFFSPAAFGTTEKRLVLVITSVLVSLGIVSLVSLVRYLSRISASLATLSNGNFNQSIQPPVRSGAEAQFATSINHISKQLRESADELERRALLIERSNQELKRMGELKMQFLSEAAHELRTPLINIEKSSGLLLEGEARPQERDFIRIINENSRRLMRLINELLDMSKMEAGMFILKREAVAVASVLEEASASVERWRQSKNLELRVRLNESLPLVWADKDRIVQVIINLLSNAIKFTPIGGTIILEGRLYEGPLAFNCPHVEVIVRDTGIGIGQDKLGTIFQKYTSTENQDREVPGTGLGLPIAKRIVEIHGGRMWAESRTGSGSVFAFTLPCTAPQN